MKADDYYGETIYSWRLIGAGWGKIGFRSVTYAPDIQKNIYAESLYDFTPPPVILISISQLNGHGTISNLYGTHIFAL